MFSNYKRVFWLAVVMSLFVYAPFTATLFSTDVWTRFARISEWADAGFPLKERLLMSQNYPFGFELHWTRPLDFIGYAFAWPFIPNWGLKRALEIMAHFVPVLVMIVAVRGFFFGLKGYLTPKVAFIAFWLFFFGIGYSWGLGGMGYYDHHIFHFALLVWSIALVARSFRVKDNKNYLIAAGIVSALGTWITPEFFINTYFLTFPFALGWLWHNRSLRPAIIYTAVYTGLLTLVMTFDHPMDGFLTLDFARTSIFHAILGGMNLILFGVLSCSIFRKNRLRRLIYAVLWVSVLGIILVVGFTDTLLVPMVEPMMYHFWISKVGEMRPLYESWNELAVYAIFPLILAVGMSFWCFFSKHRRCVPLALISIPGIFFYATVMIFHVRVGLSQNAFFIFLGSCYLNLSFFPREKSFRRSLIFILFYFLFIGIFQKGHISIQSFKAWGIKHYLEQYRNDQTINVPAYLKEAFDKAIREENEEKNDQVVNGGASVSNDEEKEFQEDKDFSCSATDKVWQKIKEDETKGAVFTDIFSGPELTWETGKPILGGPYDRNIQGLLDLFVIELDKPPFEKARELLKKHQVTQLYLKNPKCLVFLFSDEKTGKMLKGYEHFFHSAVYYETEEMPKWLKLEYRDKKTNVKVFKIIDEK